jgi:uncharacterized protein with PIN domain
MSAPRRRGRKSAAEGEDMDERTVSAVPVCETGGERRRYQNADLVFGRHYYDYQLALREVQTRTARRIAEIQARFGDAIDRAHREWGDSAQKAYEQHLDAAPRARSEEGGVSQDEAKETYREYARVFHVYLGDWKCNESR